VDLSILQSSWPEYTLIDSGEGQKLERFGPLILIRPEPKAWWKRKAPASKWQEASAVFEDNGRWKYLRKGVPKTWDLNYGRIKLQARLGDGSKHVGIFPEQEPHWSWMKKQIEASVDSEPFRLLNLFGYTGIASLVAADAGAHVTHLDASKPAIQWGRENLKHSGMEDRPIRWILDDAVKYVRREIRRGSRYDAVLLDPPSFGRGPKGEIWKVEDKLPELLDLVRQLLKPEARFVILTLYNLEASALMAKNLMEDLMPRGSVEAGELALSHENGNALLPLSLFARWHNA